MKHNIKIIIINIYNKTTRSVAEDSGGKATSKTSSAVRVVLGVAEKVETESDIREEK